MRDNLAYREGIREELIQGQVVAMSPRPAFNHNQISSNIYRIFANNLAKRKCTAISDGTDLYLDEDDQFIPDMMIVCDRSKIRWNGVHGAPDLVVEVLSPSTAKNDRRHKKEVYERHGVKEYWLADPANRTVEQYLLEDGVLALHAVYVSYPDYKLEAMKEDERAALPTQFKCSLYDDFDIKIEEIFEGLLTEE